MNLPQYRISSDESFHSYQFVSVGPKGKVVKGVQFSRISDSPIVYNLALGDIDPITGTLDDLVTTNNKDPSLVFATVGAAVSDFCGHFPEAIVFARGNTPAKQRLYQIAMSVHLAEVKKNFLVFGLSGGQWEPFTRNKTYQALLVKHV